jgi:pimeloyl-ACP methyl ester carboxylesterase
VDRTAHRLLKLALRLSQASGIPIEEFVGDEAEAS